MTRARLLFFLDLCLLIGVAALQEPRRTSLAGHEWLGIGFAALVAVHLLVSWRWIVSTLARIRGGESRRARINASLNGLLFIVVVLTVFSGLMISEVVLPLTGLSSGDLGAWRQMHGFLAGVGLAGVGLHVALNWDWIVGVLRKVILKGPRSGAAAR